MFKIINFRITLFEYGRIDNIKSKSPNNSLGLSSYLRFPRESAGSLEANSRCYSFPVTTLAGAPATRPIASVWRRGKRTPPRHLCAKSREDPPLRGSVAAALPSSCSEQFRSLSSYNNPPPPTVHDIRPSFKEPVPPPRCQPTGCVHPPITFYHTRSRRLPTNNNTIHARIYK